MQNNRGVLIVISGPSGAGKGTICKELLDKHNNIYISVSATTRSPRAGEVDGINYYFLTKESFEEKVSQNGFLEYANVHGNFYGTPKVNVEKMLEEGKDVILEIDIQGALQVKENFSEGVFIFILPPSMEELKQRIIKRGSETEESLMTRFKNAYKEINYVSKYNYAVVNDTLDLAVSKVESIIAAEKCRVDRIKENTILASFIWGNNEIGSLNDIKTLGTIAKEHDILFHSDTTQVLGKIDIDVKNLPVDFLSFSAHKIYGPKGIGAAFIRQSALADYKITSLIHGGQQENGYRAGTSPVHTIVGFGKACEIAKRDMSEYIQKITKLEIEAKKVLLEKYPGIQFLGDPDNHIPGVIGMLIPNIVNEMFIKNLADKVAISAGSACGIGEPSYVIKEATQNSTNNNFIRVAISKFNYINDLNMFNNI